MTLTNTFTGKHFILKTVGILFFLFVYSAATAQQARTYEEAIGLGDQQFEKQYYLDAKAYYQMALQLQPDDAYATGQINIIVEKMRANIELEEAYYEIIDLADVLFEEKALDKAVEQYSKALELMPDDEYARRQIDSILKSKTEDREKLEAYTKAVEGGKRLLVTQQFDEAITSFKKALSIFPDSEVVSGLIDQAAILRSEYNLNKMAFDEQVEQAKTYLLIKDYASALSHYITASELLPENLAVKSKIAELEPLALKQKSYQDKLAAADELYVGQDFNRARKLYEEAAVVWPDDPYPTDMVSRIDEQLNLQLKNLDHNYFKSIASADSLMDLQDYPAAKADYNMALTLKPNEAYPASKINEIEAIIETARQAQLGQYRTIIQAADSLFDLANYADAATNYQLALSMQADDAYPAQKLQQIQEQLLALEAAMKQEKAYTLLIHEADQLINTKQYELAIAKYMDAQAMKPGEAYPITQIEAIQKMLANAEKQRAIDQQYDQQLSLALRFLNDDKLQESRKAYEEALSLKTYEQFPKQQMAHIDSLVLEREKQEAINRSYRVFLKTGDSLQSLAQYADARIAFEQALALKPADAVVAQRILAISVIQQEIAAAAAAQKAYDDAVRKADQHFRDKNYELAKTEYEKALAAKPVEVYPAGKIKDLNQLLEQLAAERLIRYNEAIRKADNFYDMNNFEEALLEYKIAQSIKADEPHPTERIEACNTRLAEKIKRMKTQYDLDIVEADKLYTAKVYDKAIQAYLKAETSKPDETYPREMIARITKYIEDNAITDLITSPLVINSGTNQRFEFDPIPVNVRKSNYVMVKAKNIDGEAFKIIFTYGSHSGKNGGFVVQVPEGTESNDFIIRVGNQYKWFSEDNNWLDIYPENGNIEISLVRISKTD